MRSERYPGNAARNSQFQSGFDWLVGMPLDMFPKPAGELAVVPPGPIMPIEESDASERARGLCPTWKEKCPLLSVCDSSLVEPPQTRSIRISVDGRAPSSKMTVPERNIGCIEPGDVVGVFPMPRFGLLSTVPREGEPTGAVDPGDPADPPLGLLPAEPPF